MNKDYIISLLNQALGELTSVSTPTELDQAIALASAGATILISPSLVYPTPLNLSRSVTLAGTNLPAGRMDEAFTPLPKFMEGINFQGDGSSGIGLEVRRSNHLTDLVTFSGARVTLDRMRILGDPVAGAKRGIAANGNGGCKIVRCYVDDCFQASPGSDSQAIITWDMAPGLIIEDNFLRSGSEGILTGGADAPANRIPSDVIIRNNTITAKIEWMGKPIGVKTRLELKAGKRITIRDNIIENCWKQGQGGYLLSLTVRNQDGTAPWTNIEDVDISNNLFQHGSNAINILATDNVHPSGTMSLINIHNNRFQDLDPIFYQNGSTKLIQIAGGPVNLTIDHNNFSGKGEATSLYFATGPKCKNLTVKDNNWPISTYGVFGAESKVGVNPTSGLPWAWEQYVESGTFSGNNLV